MIDEFTALSFTAHHKLPLACYGTYFNKVKRSNTFLTSIFTDGFIHAPLPLTCLRESTTHEKSLTFILH
ncbi:CLUMA_CG000596, isoform A [Clunio marinus]|uniref:CLUMA_CG000596, isoform A n=1 Tax=Clunio marinus TaxID=568069 RepID=A0A1J1HH72_9DIPT|nr:CLUMA_CG000596, isoform A [Clunio marinus]